MSQYPSPGPGRIPEPPSAGRSTAVVLLGVAVAVLLVVMAVGGFLLTRQGQQVA